MISNHTFSELKILQLTNLIEKPNTELWRSQYQQKIFQRQPNILPLQSLKQHPHWEELNLNKKMPHNSQPQAHLQCSSQHYHPLHQLHFHPRRNKLKTEKNHKLVERLKNQEYEIRQREMSFYCFLPSRQRLS